MDNSEIVARIRALIEPLLDAEEIELVDIELKGKVGSQVLRIFVDVEGGIHLDRCESLSRDISTELDLEDILPGKYRLEVSSPGTDRPLKTMNDFKRNIGRRIYLTLNDGNYVDGIITKTDESNIFLELDGKDRAKISIETIVSGKIILSF